MDVFKIFFALICVSGLFLVKPSLAQNSPKDYLNAHNAARKMVGVGPLFWDRKLAAYAQSYANKRVRDCKLVLSGGPYGENLAWSSDRSLTGVGAVKLWVSKKRFYNYRSNKCVGDQSCLAYTQVVWRRSKKLGCARVKCTNGGTFVICSYSPRGNISSQRPY